MKGNTLLKIGTVIAFVLLTSCGGGSGDNDDGSVGTSSLPTDTDATSSSDPAIDPTTESSLPSAMPQVVRGPGRSRAWTSIQTNLTTDLDFSVDDTVSDFVFGYTFTTGHRHEFPPVPNSSEPFPNTSLESAITNGTDKFFYLNTSYIGSSFNESDGAAVRIRAIAFGDVTYDWYAVFISLPPSLPSESDMLYTGGFLETFSTAANVSEVASGESQFDVDLNNNLIQVILDDGLGQVLRGSNIAVVNGGFRGPITDDAGIINGIIEGQISGESGIALGGIYSYVDQNGGRAAGVFDGRR